MSENLHEQLLAIKTSVASASFRSFGQREGLELGRLLLSVAEEEKLIVSIGVDLGEQILFRASVPGTTPDYQTWIDRKFAAVRRFDASSMELELRSRLDPNFAAERALDSGKYGLYGGAIPLRIGRTLVGCVGCAGLASIDDHDFVLRIMSDFQKIDLTATE